MLLPDTEGKLCIPPCCVVDISWEVQGVSQSQLAKHEKQVTTLFYSQMVPLVLWKKSF